MHTIIASRGRVNLLAIASIVTWSVACTDGAPLSPRGSLAPSTPLPFTSMTLSGSAEVASANERSSAELLARGLALALADSAVRQEVKAAIAQSALKEGKLHFSSFIEGRGERILESMRRQGGPSDLAYSQAMGSVRKLEFYMPVSAHREKWSGGNDVLVAYLLVEEDAPVAFSTTGERRLLSPDIPPSEPVLMLTWNETNPGAQVAINRSGRSERSCEVSAGASLASSMATCAPREKNGELTSATSALFANDPYFSGLFGVFFRLLETGEQWGLGNPELEIHVFGKRSTIAGAAVPLQCAGEHAVSANYQPGIRDAQYVYDQNGHFWGNPYNFSGVRILSPAQLDTAQSAEIGGYNILIWEDDNEPCRVNYTANTLRNYLNALVPATQGFISIAVDSQPNYRTIAGQFGMSALQLYDILGNDDDFVGVIVDKSHTPYANQYPDNTHVIYRNGNVFNGRITLRAR